MPNMHVQMFLSTARTTPTSTHAKTSPKNIYRDAEAEAEAEAEAGGSGSLSMEAEAEAQF